MIKITNKGNTKVVTEGAYENFYKPLGFTIVNENEPTVKTNDIKEFKKDEVTKKDDEVIKKKSSKDVKSSSKRK